MDAEYRPGTVTFVRGPMFAGKTSYAIRMAQRLEWAHYEVVYIRPPRSRRGFEPRGQVSSHDGRFVFPVVEAYRSIADVADDYDAIFSSVRVVVLGEAMLWDDQDGLLHLVVRLRADGKMVIVESLTADKNRMPFGEGAIQVLAISDYIRTLRANCNGCGMVEAATQSWALEENDAQVDVGGADRYRAYCPACWREAWERKYGRVEFGVTAP